MKKLIMCAASFACICASTLANAAVYEVTDDGSIRILRSDETPPASVAPPPRRAARHLRMAMADAARRFEVGTGLIAAVAWTESRFDMRARSRAGASGVMQLMPATARELGVDPHDPQQNIAGGAAYLRRLLNHYHGDLILALAAYNAGPGAVDRHGGIPPYRETRAYVRRVLAHLARQAGAEAAQ